MKRRAALLERAASVIVFLSTLLLGSQAANAALIEFFSATGKLSLSVDGAGSNTSSHSAQVEKPNASATVRKAYVMAASYCGSNTIPDNSISINGHAITWDDSVVNSFAFNVRADVTSIVKPLVDSSAAGRIDFTFVEDPTWNTCIDGEVLVVVFDDPAQAGDTTIILLFGGQALDGDTFAITLAEPIDPDSAGARADMGLGISFGFQPSDQYSIVNVNGQRLSSSAGGQDDGGPFNGGLITVGGLDDSNANPPNPSATGSEACPPNAAPRCDDELYSLLPLINANDTNISVFTQNPSNDDNIFFAWFQLSGAAILGEGIVLGPPSASNPIGTQHTVTAKVVNDNGVPVQGKLVTFNVTSGPNAGKNGTNTTDANGEATFTYTGNGGAGTDQLQASFVDSQENTKTSNTVTKEWTGSSCEAAEGPCIGGLSEIKDRLYDDPLGSAGPPAPGVTVRFDWANITSVELTKTAQAVPLGQCGVDASNKVTKVDVRAVPSGALLTATQVKKLKESFKKFKKLKLAKRQALLAATNGSGSFEELKVFSFNKTTLDFAVAHGCAGVRLVYSYRLIGKDAGGQPSQPLEGAGTLDWFP